MDPGGKALSRYGIVYLHTSYFLAAGVHTPGRAPSFTRPGT
jgi:hypothetical protein